MPKRVRYRFHIESMKGENNPIDIDKTRIASDINVIFILGQFMSSSDYIL